MKNFKKGRFGWIFTGSPMKPKVLDIGCGLSPTGDVNCDLYIEKTFHRDKHEAKEIVNVKSIPNFVKCDAHFLAFKNKAFYETYCANVLEHIGINPSKVIKEMIRVSKRKITIIVPHRFSAKYEMHDKYYNVTSFDTFFRKMGYNPKITKTYNVKLVRLFFSFFRFPNQITVQVMLK